jgi:predicted MFS family arabinose efflux permease
VATELIPAVALATVPLAAVTHTLTLAHLYVVAVIAGAAASVSNAAFWPYLTTLVHADKLIVANSRHEVSRSLAEIGGPSLGGVLVQLLGPPVAVAVDALSFLISGLLLHANTDHERIEHASASRGGVKDDIVAGMVLVLRDPLLRVLTVSSTLGIVCFSATVSILVLYMTRDLGHSPGELGIVFAAGGLGALAGALMASRVSHRLGIGPTVIGAEVAIGSAGLLIPLAGALPAVALPLLAVALLVRGATLTIYNVTWNSLIQTIVPQDTQGRVYASSNALIFSLQPVGALGGGFLGQTLGLQATLLVTAVAWSLVFVFPLASPLRDVRDLSALRH